MNEIRYGVDIMNQMENILLYIFGVILAHDFLNILLCRKQKVKQTQQQW